MRAAACLLLALATAPAQTPGGFFESAGVGFRGTSEEQQLFWKPHIEASHRRIVEAAELTGGNGIATVLGAGVCSEIPLEEVARRFERVILADMDGASMVEAVERLPLELRSKVELRISDVTTFAAPLMEEIQVRLEATESAEEAFTQLDALFGALRTGVIPTRLPPSDFVVSSLVASELYRYPLAYAERLLRTKHGVKIGRWPGFGPARERLQRVIITDHFSVIAAISKPGAVVYFSDTTERAPAYARISPALRRSVEASTAPSLLKLGLIEAGDDPSAFYGRPCHGHYGVAREIRAFEILLNAYETSAEEAFEALLPLEHARRQWGRRGFQEVGEPDRWWWLEYPCAIVHSPGAFRVRNWVLRRSTEE